MICFINGKQLSKISVMDRAVQFGDGCFTTIRVVGQQPALLPYHICRLQNCVQKLLLPMPDWNKLADDVKKIAQFNKSDLAVIKIIISRGKKIGSKLGGYSIAGFDKSTVIVFLNDYPNRYLNQQKTGINLILSSIPINRNKYLAGIKHLNRLEQILIKQQTESFGMDEAIVMDINGQLIGCCAANIFFRKANHIYTPDLNYAGVKGVMRRKIIEYLSTSTTDYQLFYINTMPNILTYCDELIITNSLMPILSVNCVINNDRQYVFKQQSNCRQLFDFLLPYSLRIN